MGSIIKILFVDDEKDIIYPLASETEELGYESLMAESVSEGIDHLKTHNESIALVIADFHMGVSDGLDFRRQMIELGYKNIPFIIYSGFVNQDMLRKAIDLKVSRLRDKPFDHQRIKSVILEDAKDRIELIEEKLTLKKIFLDEATDLLEDLETEIIALEGAASAETINNIFRLVHTIKGGSGVLDWPDFTKAVHAYEDLLTKVKDNKVEADNQVITILLKGYDFVLKIINGLKEDEKVNIDVPHWVNVFSASGATEKDTAATPAEAAGTTTKQSSKGEDDVIKVPTKILDEFMELSGEITVIRNTVNKLVSNLQKEFSGNSDLYQLGEFLEEMHKINSSMQNKITELRKVSLKSIFRTYPRTVRDLNLSLGKQIDLKVDGEELRVDTKLAQVLKNSLIHVVRNSADHGIEDADKRASNNKPAKGTINLRSIEQGDDIIVEVEDDGGGINPDAILNRAKEKNLFPLEVLNSMSEKQIFKIILEAGFSTAAQVTDISGRGVGMDMVKSSVESIGGRIDIDSTLGMGTKFSLKLPIPKSVMIIQSLLVKIGEREFNIPQDNIIRLIKIEGTRRQDMIRKAQGCDLLNLDGNLIQLTNLTETLSPGSQNTPLEDRESIDIVLAKSEKLIFGIIVDEIKDAEEIVVKNIPNQIKNKIYKGATFMGDGSVGLILDVDGIAEFKDILDTETQEQNTSFEKESSTQIDHEEGKEYIIFTLPTRGLFCFHLEDVYRLEELSTKEFTKVSGQLSTIYLNQVTPLHFIHDDLGMTADKTLLEREKQNTIIIDHKDRYYGLIIDEIKEIRLIKDAIDTDIADRKEIEGSIIFEDTVITVIDIYTLLGLEKQQALDHHAPESKAPDKVEEVSKESEDSNMVAGFGLF